MNHKQKLLELIDQYAEARHIQGHSTYNIKTAAARREVEDELERALSGVGETVAWAIKVGEELDSAAASLEIMRDYFAAKAMQSYLLDKDRDSFTFEQWAQASYEMADAMLKARKKNHE